MSSIQTIGLTAHRNKEGAHDALRLVRDSLHRRGMSAIVDEATAQALGEKDPGMPFQVFVKKADAFISLGGDGTLLHIADLIAPTGKPLAGVNLGRMGFLSACSLEHFETLLDSLQQGTYRLEKRAMLEALLVENSDYHSLGIIRGQYVALNEVAIMRGKTGRMVDVETFIDGDFLTNYHADGLLVATPSGSTAYSLSAGGPIISPEASVLCLTPVSPHSLTTRSLVIADASTVEIKSRQNSDTEYLIDTESPLIFSVDGQEMATLGQDMSLRVRKSPWGLNIVRMADYSFAELLRGKLRWRGAEV